MTSLNAGLNFDSGYFGPSSEGSHFGLKIISTVFTTCLSIMNFLVKFTHIQGKTPVLKYSPA